MYKFTNKCRNVRIQNDLFFELLHEVDKKDGFESVFMENFVILRENMESEKWKVKNEKWRMKNNF